MDILKNVDILDKVRVHVYRDAPTPGDPMPYKVFVEAVDQTKKVIFDEDALKILNNKLTEKVQQFDDGRDPRVQDYIKEFASRMLSELARNGLVALEDIPDGPEDPYAAVRKKY